MKKILVALAGSLLLGASASYAKLPPPPPKSDAEKTAEADKAKAAAAKDAADLAKAQDRAVANYKRSHGGAAEASKNSRKKK